VVYEELSVAYDDVHSDEIMEVFVNIAIFQFRERAKSINRHDGHDVE
jgi:hypothetical protein